MKLTHLASSLLLATIDSSDSGGGARLWVSLGMLLIGIVLIVRCVVRGHEARDLRSLWTGIALLIAAVAVWVWPGAPSSIRMSVPDQTARQDVAKRSPEDLAARQVIARRCSACHSSHTTLMPSAPWRLNFDQPGAIDRLAPAIYRQVVVLKSMPVGNMTHMTPAERAIIARWYQQRMQPPVAAHDDSANR